MSLKVAFLCVCFLAAPPGTKISKLQEQLAAETRRIAGFQK